MEAQKTCEHMRVDILEMISLKLLLEKILLFHANFYATLIEWARSLKVL